MTDRVASLLSVFCLATTIGLTGCETHPFSGSAAMRIDVEVYKGPLSEEPETQWGNLWGLLDQAERGLIETDNVARSIFAHKGFLDLRHDAPNGWPLLRLDKVGSPVQADNSPAGTQPFKTDSVCYHVQAESPWYSFRFWRLFGVLDDIDHYDCSDLVTLINDIGMAIAEVQDLRKTYVSLRLLGQGCQRTRRGSSSSK